MGFFDKVKNMFTEEVEDEDVKVEQIKKNVTHVPIESPNAHDEAYNDEIIQNFEFESTQKISKPVFFDDNDFKDLNLTDKPKKVEEEIVKEKSIEKEIYNVKSEEKVKEEEKKIFKPTPIISPVYGVLDKNYHKEDIVSKTPISSEEEGEPSIESIRNKAYGTLEDELENTLFGSNSILFKHETKEEPEVKEEINDDVLSNLTDDISKELDELLIKKEKYSDSEIKRNLKKNDNINEDDLLGFIDSTLYKEGDE